MKLTRRQIVAGLATTAITTPFAHAHPLFATRDELGLYTYGDREPVFGLEELMPGNELRLSHFDVVEISREAILLRAVATDGSFGVVAASPNKWWEVKPLLQNLVLPYLEGEDVLEIEAHWWRFLRGEYEYSGNPLWNAWGHAETAVLDLIGQVTAKPVAELLGGVKRTDIPMYISGGQRGGDPQREVDALAARLEETGCKGVKVKIGRRMSRNEDAGEGWTENIISAVRRHFGDELTLYVDANGAFDAQAALALAPMLEDYGVDMIEEPCSFLDPEMTGQITRGYRARRSRVLIASGENEGNPVVWRDLIDQHRIDVGQPDPQYGGGLLHCMMIARRLDAAGLKLNPHWPRQGGEQAPLIHLCAAAPDLWGLHEYRLRPRDMPYKHEDDFVIRDGIMRLPDAPGFGVRYDPGLWQNAVRLEAA